MDAVQTSIQNHQSKIQNPPDLVLGIDLGTSYFKLGLFDRSGALRGLGRIAVAKDTDDGTRCEVPVARFWSLLQSGVADACAQAQAAPTQIRALAYSSQANSSLLLDANDEPLTPLVLWCDARAKDLNPALAALWTQSQFLARTGLGVPFGPGFLAANWYWMRHHEPTVASRTRRILSLADYFTYTLTRRTVGDGGTAALLGLLDLPRMDWWDDALNAAGIPRACLVQPQRPGTVVGPLHPDGAQRLGLPAGIPFAVGSLDHHVAAIGAGAGRLADVSLSLGTVLACLRYSHAYQPRHGACMGPGVGGYDNYQLTFSGHGAAALEWYHRTHAASHTLPELDRLAAQVPPGADGLIALPQADQCEGLTGFRNARPTHGPGHYFRALMESRAAELVGLVDKLGGAEKPARIVATGGGARSRPWLQVLADVIGAEFVTTRCQEPACLGAAMFAAVAAGWQTSLHDVAATWIAQNEVVTPDPAEQPAYGEWLGEYRRCVQGE
jgi:xylulokinase